MANDVNRLIDMLYERIEDAKSPALKPNMSMVDRDELLDLLDELRAQLPVEIKQMCIRDRPEAEHDGCRHLDIKCQCKQEGRAVQGHGGEPVAQPAPQAGHQGQQQELPGLHRAPPFQKERGVSA